MDKEKPIKVYVPVEVRFKRNARSPRIPQEARNHIQGLLPGFISIHPADKIDGQPEIVREILKGQAIIACSVHFFEVGQIRDILDYD